MSHPHPCTPRRRFATREAVQAASVRIANYQGQQRLPEACPRCGGWHLAAPDRRPNTNHQQLIAGGLRPSPGRTGD